MTLVRLRSATCGRCGGRGFTSHSAMTEHTGSAWTEPCRDCSGTGIVQRDSRETSNLASALRSKAFLLRANLGPIGSSQYIARSAKAEAYEEAAEMVEQGQ